MRYEAIIATTNLLPNAHRFTENDLLQIAAMWPDGQLLFREHRMGRGAIGRIVGMRVGSLPRDPAASALFVTFEPLEGVPLDDVENFLREGFSLGFFGLGFSNVDGEADLTIGLSPDLARSDELELALRRLEESVPGVSVSVRQYHEHADHPGTVLLIVLGGWLLKKVGDKVFDAVWNAITRSSRENPERITVVVELPRTKVTIEGPAVGEWKLAITEGLREAERLAGDQSPPDQVFIDFNDGQSKTSALRLPRPRTNEPMS